MRGEDAANEGGGRDGCGLDEMKEAAEMISTASRHNAFHVSQAPPNRAAPAT